jgi:hypothetical protein
MKNRIVLDFGVFNSILRELKAVRRELRSIKGENEKKALPKRVLKDPINTQDVLKMLKVSPATLISYEKKGLLQYHKEGQSKVYSQAEVSEFKRTKGRRKRITKSLLRKKFSPQKGRG